MKAIIIYCSKTGNTQRVATAIQIGLGGNADVIRLDLNNDGLLREFCPDFKFDLAEYDLIFFGGWTMVMKMHPFLTAYIQRCENIVGKRVVGFATGGAIFSRNHAMSDFVELIESRGAKLLDFHYVTTLLGPLLTNKKLMVAKKFAADIADRFNVGNSETVS